MLKISAAATQSATARTAPAIAPMRKPANTFRNDISSTSQLTAPPSTGYPLANEG
jgi:hypothetical protein